MGEVAGLSGAGIMSGLATAGTVIGGGAAAGIGVVAAGIGVVAAGGALIGFGCYKLINLIFD